MDSFKKGWYTETSDMWPGQALSMEVEEVLVDTKSAFQHLLMLKTKIFGHVLVLDGAIQVTDLDECSYQEMIAHIPMMAHKNPKRVCIIGGGDGGALNEVCKYSSVEEVVLCEIDQLVMDVSKKYYPKYANGWADPRTRIHCADGCAFLRNHKDYFDVIIVDASDPIGPAATLFEVEMYKNMFDSLKSDGICCTQGECMWIHMDLIERLVKESKKIYKHVNYASISQPTYPCGQIGFVVCSKGPYPTSPSKSVSDAIGPENQKELRYYSEEIHKAAFVLPPFVKKRLGE